MLGRNYWSVTNAEARWCPPGYRGGREGHQALSVPEALRVLFLIFQNNTANTAEHISRPSLLLAILYESLRAPAVKQMPRRFFSCRPRECFAPCQRCRCIARECHMVSMPWQQAENSYFSHRPHKQNVFLNTALRVYSIALCCSIQNPNLWSW